MPDWSFCDHNSKQTVSFLLSAAIRFRGKKLCVKKWRIRQCRFSFCKLLALGRKLWVCCYFPQYAAANAATASMPFLFEFCSACNIITYRLVLLGLAVAVPKSVSAFVTENFFRKIPLGPNTYKHVKYLNCRDVKENIPIQNPTSSEMYAHLFYFTIWRIYARSRWLRVHLLFSACRYRSIGCAPPQSTKMVPCV